MKIGNIDLEKKVFIIAEAGNCHEGDVGRAREMIFAANQAGADAIKFQTIVPERLVSSDQKNRIAQLKKFQLTYDEFVELADTAMQAGILFLSTPFDVESALFLAPLVPAFKIASGDLTFAPLLSVVTAQNKPILLSTGGSTMEEVRDAYQSIQVAPICLLHCVLAYPTPVDRSNLQRINMLREISTWVGYSDHTQGTAACAAAVAMGARVIEKHFTLDKQLSDFRDHQLAADPGELFELVGNIREVEQMMGTAGVEISEAEVAAVPAVRRSALDWLRHST